MHAGLSSNLKKLLGSESNDNYEINFGDDETEVYTTRILIYNRDVAPVSGTA